MAKKTEQKGRPKKDAMLKALAKTLGNVSEACQMVGIGRTTHYEWFNNDPDYKQAVNDIDENNIDIVEGQLHKLIMGYTMPETKVFYDKDTGCVVTHDMVKHVGPDTTATIFYLKTKGKNRGYVEKQQIEQSGTSTLIIEHVATNNEAESK